MRARILILKRREEMFSKEAMVSVKQAKVTIANLKKENAELVPDSEATNVLLM